MIEEDLLRWRQSERAAFDAEGEVRRIGQAAADPRVAELVMRAKRLREAADGLLSELIRRVIGIALMQPNGKIG